MKNTLLPLCLSHNTILLLVKHTVRFLSFLPFRDGDGWWMLLVSSFLSSCWNIILFLQNELKLNRTETRQRWERKSVWFDSLLRKFNLFWFYSLWTLGRRRRLTLSLSTWKSFVQQKNLQKKKWNIQVKRRRGKTHLHLNFVCFYVWLLHKHNSSAFAQWELSSSHGL